MSESSQASSRRRSSTCIVEGVGYLNRVRTVKPKKGQEFLVCTVAALRGSDSDVSYTKFDCRVSGADAQAIVKRLEDDVAADKSVIIGFRIADIYPEMFTFEKGDRKGQPGVSIRVDCCASSSPRSTANPSMCRNRRARGGTRESVPF